MRVVWTEKYIYIVKNCDFEKHLLRDTCMWFGLKNIFILPKIVILKKIKNPE